jgi:hypothetical protein
MVGEGGFSSVCAAREQFCFLTSPEYLRTFRGKYLFSFQARGRLVLAEDELLFYIRGRKLCVPFWRVRAIALRRFPWRIQLFGLRYIAVEFTNDEGERAVWLTPTYRLGLAPWLTNRIVIRWYGWLAEALRQYRERT